MTLALKVSFPRNPLVLGKPGCLVTLPSSFSDLIYPLSSEEKHSLSTLFKIFSEQIDVNLISS